MSIEPFTAEHADAAPGDEWLRQWRRERLAQAMAQEIPSDEAEEWRYSRIGSYPEGDFAPVGAQGALSSSQTPARLPGPVADILGRTGDHCGHVVTIDGVVAAQMDCADADAAGVRFGPALDAALLGSVMTEPPDYFSAWNGALTAAPVVLDVPPGVELEAPFVVVHHASSDGSAVFPRLVIHAGENSRVSVLEVFVSDDVRALIAPVTEVAVDRAARLRHTVVQDLGPRVWQIGSLAAEVGQEATWDAGVAQLGGDYARLRMDCRLVGRGAAGNIAAAYLGGRRQMIDLRTFQVHAGEDTTSDLYFKGALAEAAHSVYTGLIHILPEGRGSDAVQANRVIKLSDDTWAESVPNLEIENNDVRCAHGSTVGPVDAEQRYYLESRGIPPRIAERLIVGGFFDDALAHFPTSDAVGLIAERIDAQLDRELMDLAGAAR